MAKSNIHSFLQTALDAVPREQRPDAPAHGGVAATPQLGRLGATGVAVFLADRVAKRVAAKDRKRFASWVAQAHEVYRRQAHGVVTIHTTATWRRRSLTREERDVMQRSLELAPRSVCYLRDTPEVLALPPALHVGNAAALVAFDLEMGGGGPYATVAVRDAIRHAVALADDPRAFIAELDRVILREELRSTIWQRGDARCLDVEACLWRAAAAGKATHLLGRMFTGDHVLVFKVGSKWTVFVGPRDEVLATVPDPHLESAVDAVRH